MCTVIVFFSSCAPKPGSPEAQLKLRKEEIKKVEKKVEDTVDVKLKLICLSGKERKELLDTINWKYVSKHLKEVGKEESTYNKIVEFIEKSKYFCVFVIEDNNCLGLRGAEFESWEKRMKNYRGFVKSENISVKENQGAGSQDRPAGTGENDPKKGYRSLDVG